MPASCETVGLDQQIETKQTDPATSISHDEVNSTIPSAFGFSALSNTRESFSEILDR
jgi:hypothetical protein